MRKGEMIELIQRLIKDEAVAQLKKRRKASPHDPPQMSDDELDSILFHGGMPVINEDFDRTAKINQSDITAFEQKMHEIVSNTQNAVLSFDQQPNGHSILLKKSNGIMVMASGNIKFGSEGELRWLFSIPNGFTIGTAKLKINPTNKTLISDLADYYDSWQKDWRAKLLAPDQGASLEDGQTQAPPSPTAGARVEEPPGPDSAGAANNMNV